MMLNFLLKTASVATITAIVAQAASLVEVTNYGSNPGSVRMHLYVPDRTASNPPVVVAMHGCGGSGPSYYQQTKYASLADTYGYIVIYPSATRQSNCFDANTGESLTHSGGSDSLSIVNQVKYVLSTYSADATCVFSTGTSSGGIMTNVLLGAYPDVFAAGSVFSGMPFACLFGNSDSTPSTTNRTCPQGLIRKSGAEWANYVRSAYPGYAGKYPRMQTWHGTVDALINYQCFVEMIKEWTTVLGVTFTRNETNTPLSGYTKMVYGGDGNTFVAYSAQGVGHVVPTQELLALQFFGINSSGGTATTTMTTTTTTTPRSSTTSSTRSTSTTTGGGSGGCQSPKWGQCGGIGWTGCTACVSGTTCQVGNPYYSQCL